MSGLWFALLGVLTAVGVTTALLVAIARHDRARRAADEREDVLLRLLRTDSLQPGEILDAVVNGLAAAGFDACSVRLIDEDAGVLRYVAGRGITGAAIPAELPLTYGFSGRVLQASAPVVVDDYSRLQDALNPRLGFRGAIGVPLGPAGRPIAVLLAARRDLPLTAGQQAIAIELSEQAGRALEQALRFEARAADVEELRALDARTHDFVSIVSHELRTPLTVVQGLGQTLAQRWHDLDAPRREDLSIRLHANVERLESMVATLLETSARQQGALAVRPEAVVLADLIEAVLHRRPALRMTHPVTVEVDDRLRVLADPRLLEHVFENLLGNLERHTPQGTAARVSTTILDGSVRVEVADEGPGIPAADLPFVLERFYRGGDPTRRGSGGLGLGLALAEQVVNAHGSHIEVESVPGLGTTFRFWLPPATAYGPVPGSEFRAGPL